MDILTDKSRVERLEIVDTGRRRRFSDAEKIRIVEESLSAPRMGSATARRHGIAVPLIFAWRKAYREGQLGHEAPSFYPVRLDGSGGHASDGSLPPEPPTDGSASPVEIVLRNGRRMIMRSDIAPEVLGRLLDVVDR
ncbi:IS66-like element accessory protein TnpA [Pelagibacterium sp.]